MIARILARWRARADFRRGEFLPPADVFTRDAYRAAFDGECRHPAAYRVPPTPTRIGVGR